MESDFTPAVARALEAADLAGTEPGAAPVSALLAALLAEEEGRVAGLFRRVGLDPAGLRPALERVGSMVPARIALTAAAALARAQTGLPTVQSEHLLLALVRADPDLLQRVGVSASAVGRLLDALTADARPLRPDEMLDLGEPTETIDTARLIDATANRAREALRVLEDYCRFVLDDAFLSRELKGLRHDLAEALEGVPAALLLTARETRRDVGTALSTVRERERSSPRQVVLANAKRLQEALRSLEEFGKCADADTGAKLERLRYRGYTLEKALLTGADARERLADARLYLLVSGAGCVAALDWTIAEAAAGGVQIVQLREKGLSDRALLERARQVRRWTREAGVLLVLNDRPDLARLAEADGVHLGQDDLPVKEARRILGPEALIGVSTHDLDQVRQAVLDGASYLGVGPTFPSTTKTFETLAGLDFVRRAMAETSLPTFAIGGLTPANVGEAVAVGAKRVAVEAAVARADDPRRAAAALRQGLG